MYIIMYNIQIVNMIQRAESIDGLMDYGFIQIVILFIRIQIVDESSTNILLYRLYIN